MNAEQNKTIARRYFEDVWNRGDLAAIDVIVASNAAGHAAGLSLAGTGVLRQRVTDTRVAYPDLRFTVEDVFAENDRVLVRWTFSGTHTGSYMGYPGTGRSVSVTGMNVFRLAGGRIVELWTNGDDLGELQQLGILPALK